MGGIVQIILQIAFVMGLAWMGTGCSSVPASSKPIKPVETSRKGFLQRVKDGSAPSQKHEQQQREQAQRHEQKKYSQKQQQQQLKQSGRIQPLPSKTIMEKQRETARGEMAREVKPTFLEWPLREPLITSSFGKRNGEFHEGIDLRAKSGTPIYAAKTGIVLYAESGIKGYGKLVVLRHEGKISTIYAHNSRILVRRGQRVTQGQQIALSGNTGHSTGPHLHFEVRRGLSSVNPLRFLPIIATASASEKNVRLASQVK